MNNDWSEYAKTRIKLFYLELENCCRNCRRDPKSVSVIFATKYLDNDQFASFVSASQEMGIAPAVVGENKVQEMEAKIEFINTKFPERLNYFYPVMIGSLQTNKVNKALLFFREIHAIDSLKLAQALETRLVREKKQMAVFLELNISGEKSKHGMEMIESERFIDEVGNLPHLQIKGLMTIAPIVSDPEQVRPIFKALRKIANSHNLLTSMGMSNDWKVAVEEGTDIVRIGRRIFR
jgi:pyridoxal phosphate enzyme (YggS family)